MLCLWSCAWLIVGLELGTAENSLDVASWTKKVLSQEAMFAQESEAQEVVQTSGLCSKEEFGKKRKQILSSTVDKAAQVPASEGFVRLKPHGCLYVFALG